MPKENWLIFLEILFMHALLAGNSITGPSDKIPKILSEHGVA